MDIMELGAIGELVGALVVMGSLVFVGMQVRHNTAATRAVSHNAITDSVNEWNLAVAREPSLADLWTRGIEDLADLSVTERVQFDMLPLAGLRVFETQFFQSDLRTGNRHLLVGDERSLRALFSNPGLRQWWEENPYALEAEFRDYIEATFLGSRPARGA